MNRIKELRKEKGIGQKEIASYMGVSVPAVSDWENCKKEPTTRNAIMLANFFGVSVAYLTGQENEKEKQQIGEPISDDNTVLLPVVATVAAGYDQIADTDIIEMYSVHKSLLRGYPANECRIVQVKGNSMYPFLLDGDKAIYHMQTSIDSGKIAVVQYNSDETTIKKIVYEMGKPWFDLVPINPEYQTRRIQHEELELCRIYGLVIGMIRDNL